MFSVYPSNKLEHLSALLNGLTQAQPLPVFERETILVESPGMQHWLNLNLAEQNGISMNLDFPLTTRFVWDIARQVLGDDAIPAHSPYRREVLRFRILSLFNDTEFVEKSELQGLSQFWQSAIAAQAELKKLNLAIEIADAFEQYILFRPQWLSAWESGMMPSELNQNNIAGWQSTLWRKLVEQQPWHPANLLAQTSQQLHALVAKNRLLENLPKRILIFAVNALAPSLLHFFDALALHCDIHFFYLNPSVSYWGELKSDSAKAHELRQIEFDRSLQEHQDNRLLANLGQHGRDLLNRLAQMQTFEISAFDAPISEDERMHSLLSKLQQAVYQGQTVEAYETASDDSIHLVSCHTALRELQVLHDYLLKSMTNQANLTGRDIIVLCPAIEDYAPYIHSVFAKPGEQTATKISCSISDRSLLTTDSHVQAFMTLLSLPDSRFKATSILAFVEQSDIAQQFGLESDAGEIIRLWLDAAAIRWGLNEEHKQQQASIQQASKQNSWEWGLKRLLTGLAASDNAQIVDDMLTVPDVEGLDMLILGNLMRLVLFLQQTNTALSRTRDLAQWVSFLQHRCDSLFSSASHNSRGVMAIKQALFELNSHATQANFTQSISFQEVKELLSQALSSPDVRNQFLTGHVTFCSMMPMRSVPFDIVAVLGLNDGQFPRKTQQQSLNIMSMLSPLPGDRSRAKEDRYLFLEAILSARKTLYLSYQGASARDNTERQPSTVLTLLQQELAKLHPDAGKVLQYPLHHYSAKNYQSPVLSDHKGGYRLASSIYFPSQTNISGDFVARFSEYDSSEELVKQCSSASIAHCLHNPLAFLATQVLGVNLTQDDSLYNDDEPFDVDSLVQYKALDTAIEQVGEIGAEHSLNQVISQLRLSGCMPDSVIADAMYQSWQHALERLIKVLPTGFEERQLETFVVQHCGVDITTEAKLVGEHVIDLHIGAQTAKRKLSQWIRHVMVNCSSPSPVTSKVYYIDWKKSVKITSTTNASSEQRGEIRCTQFNGLDNDKASECMQVIAQAFLRCLSEPCLLHARMGEAVCRAKKEPENTWHTHLLGNAQLPGLCDDPYFKWLINNEPQWQDWQESITQLYAPMVAAIKDTKVSND